jgi:2'-5' RNA ligase
MLPDNGAQWEQVGSNEARVTLSRFSPAIVLHLTLDERGAVREVVGQRWSNANREQRFRFQPFGGTMTAKGTFQGLTIPTGILVGNHYGTEDYLPFFQARITQARFF